MTNTPTFSFGFDPATLEALGTAQLLDPVAHLSALALSVPSSLHAVELR